jgi:hypothetical protein
LGQGRAPETKKIYFSQKNFEDIFVLKLKKISFFYFYFPNEENISIDLNPLRGFGNRSLPSCCATLIATRDLGILEQIYLLLSFRSQ